MINQFDTTYNNIILDEKNRFAPYLASALLATSPLDAEAVKTGYSDNIPQKSEESSSKSFSKHEQHNIIARTLWAEARNDGILGMDAVASIIYNRGYGDVDKMIDAIKAKKQFSCWNGMTEEDWSNFKMKKKSGSEWDIANNIATKIMHNVYKPSHTFDHYFNPKKARPDWGYVDKQKTKLKPHTQIGKHVFMEFGNWVTGR